MAHVLKCNVTLNLHDSGWLVFRFSSEANMLKVLRRGPHSVQGKPLVIKPMPLYFDFGKLDMSSVPVWVCFLNLPLKCWSHACLSKISSVIGKVIRCDDLTLSMFWVFFARVMIEVDLLADLPCSVNLSMPDGTIIKQRVIYEYMLKICSYCCMLGHTSNACQKLNTGVEDSPTSRMVKRAHVSPSSSSDEAVAVNPVISQPSGDACPNVERVVIRSQEAVRRGKKGKAPSSA
ncbi:hypothetical protein Peur_026455 [Populus x canadensis]